MPSQQMTTEPALMKGVERINTVVVRSSGQGMEVPSRRDSYVMEVDRGRNSYACGDFGHMARYCRNRGRGRAMEERRVEYGEGRFKGNIKQIGYLKEMENLEALN